MQKVSKFLAEDLVVFEQKFRSHVSSHVPLLDKIMHYIVKRKGKQMRPMFVLLCAKCLGEINEKTFRAASLVELLHTATLVHDDVVDDAKMRRGFFSINALWKNKIAVLVGDYLLSKGLLLSLENDDFEILKILSSAVKQMSEGELLQMEKARNLDITEDVYYSIIKGKTASLLAACCGAGVASVTTDADTIKNAMQFGEYVGMAFQIKDDLFDYGFENVGKPTGNDIKEKKMTLPLIYTLNVVDSSKKKKLIHIVKNNNNDKQKVKYVIDEVINNGGIAYATQKMIDYKTKALHLLNTFPESPSKNILLELVNYSIDRKF